MTSDPRRIGVFDSGLGGLTVLRTLKNSFPGENFLYLGDTARLPYGTKSPETIRNYCIQNIEFLLKWGVKAVVVACNSASSQYQETILGVTPIYNVIGPGADTALKASSSQRIGILGTRATVLSGAYEREILNRVPTAKVFSQACPLFVPLAEEGWIDDPLTNLIVYRYLQELMIQNIDTLILGCTHYPILKSAIAKVAGPNVTLVESGEALAVSLGKDLRDGKVVGSGGTDGGTIELMTTDYSPHLIEQAERIVEPFKFSSVKCVYV